MNTLRKYPLFVFLLPVFFVLHGYRENLGFVPVPDALMLLVIYLAFAASFLFAAWLLLRDWLKAGLFSFSIMAVHFFFGAVHDLIRNQFPGTFIVKYSFLLPFLLVVLVILFIVLRRRIKPVHGLGGFLNLLLLVLLTLEFAWLASSYTRRQPAQTLPNGLTRCDDCPKPDIYVVIADEYAGEKQLRDIFSFDNGNFLQQLRNRGFHTIKNSTSNYNFTPYSIASTLDMNYLGFEHSEKKQLLAKTYERTRNNTLLKFLEANGYEFHNLTLLDYKGQPARVDETFLPVRTRLITAQTLLSRVNRDLRFNLVTRLQSEKEVERLTYRTLNNNRSLAKATKDLASKASSKPRFILTHLMMPHYPYYFDRNGNPFPYDQVVEGNQHRLENYVEYLQYANGEFLKLVDHIQSNAKQPPIIIFLSDHGFRHFRKEVDPSYYFYNHVSLYIPKSDYAMFPDSLSNVNLFRALLNSSFGQKLNYLRDTTYIMENP